MFTRPKHCTVQNNRAVHIGSVPLGKIPYDHVAVTPDKNVIKPGWPNHKPMISTPLVGRGFTSNGQGDPTTPCPKHSTVAEDSYLGRGDLGFLPTLKTHNLIHRTPFASPAKVFAKLKAKVHREQICESEVVGEEGTERVTCPRSETQEGRLLSPRKRQHAWTIAELKENQRLATYDVEALTLSPTCSPQKAFSHPYSPFTSKDLPLSSPRKDVAAMFKPVNRSPKRQIREESPKKAVSQSHPLANSTYHQRPALVARDTHVFRATGRATPVMDKPPSLKSSANSYAIGLPGVGVGQHHNLKPRVVVEKLSLLDYGPPRHESTSIPASQDLEDETSMDVSSGITSSVFTAPTAQSETSTSPIPEVADGQCQSDIDEAPPLTANHRPALVDDQQIQASPKISIPKKRQASFLPKTAAEAEGSGPDANVAGTHLRKWALMFNGTGLFVEGFCRERDMVWHSNIITERVSSNVVKTVSGSIYVLVGKMDMDSSTRFSSLPRWLLKLFLFGFPQKWKIYFDKFLSEPQVMSQVARPQPRRPQPPKKPLASSAPCLPEGPKVSRSGRVSRPPLEFWKGARIIVDASMNVTVLDDYNTTICEEPESTPVARQKSRRAQRPAEVFLNPEDSSGVEEEEFVPLRKVKMAHRRPQTVSTDPEEPSLTNAPKGRNLRPRKSSPPHQRAEESVSPPEHRRRFPRKKALDATQGRGRDLEDEGSRSDDDFTDRKRPKRKTRSINHLLESSDNDSLSLRKKRIHSQKLAFKSSDEDLPKPQPKQRTKTETRTKPMTKTQIKTKSKSPTQPKPQPKTDPQTETRAKAQIKPKTDPQAQMNKQSSRGRKSRVASKVALQEEEEEEERWSKEELVRLHDAVTTFPKNMFNFWLNVATAVGTRSAEECQEQYTAQKSCPGIRKKKGAPPKKDPVLAAEPQITAKVGTLKRKQQMRNFLDHMPKDDHDDIFSSSPMQNKLVKLPTVSPSGREPGVMSLGEVPQTPGSAGYPTVKTPQCLHITPGMMGPTNINDDDKYLYQLQKRMRARQVKAAPTSKFTPTPPVKRAVKRCISPENGDGFVIREMFPAEEVLTDESEQDDYFDFD